MRLIERPTSARTNTAVSKFSIIVALYNVERYLDTFINSIIRQSYPLENLEVIIVDDGSTDSSYAMVKAWSERYPELIRHTSKENGGPASARNVGLDLASHEWVAFCDPDDALDRLYFQKVAAFIERDRDRLATMLTTRVMIWQEETKRIKNTHPLGRKFSYGECLVDLNHEPNFAQLGGASVFLLRALIQKHDIRLSELIKPTFEDAEFIGRYLSLAPRQVVGIIPSAKYLYRKRGDGSSLVQSSWLKRERYQDVLEFGYLGLLEGLHSRLGYVPDWAQNMVLYDMGWYLSEETKMRSASAWIDKEILEGFHILLKRIFVYIDRQRIENYNMSAMSWIIRQAMLSYFKGANLFPLSAVRWTGASHPINMIGYAYGGDLPLERFMVDGVEVEAIETKSVRHEYYGEAFFFERKIWLPAGMVTELWLDGRYTKFVPTNVRGWTRPRGDLELGPRSIGQAYSEGAIAQAVGRVTPPPMKKVIDKARNRISVERLVGESNIPVASIAIARRMLARRAASRAKSLEQIQDQRTRAWALSNKNASVYSNAWILMDRPDHAGDNAEHLYRYVMNEQPRTNAWFLLNRDSHDWERLKSEGFRLIEYGSRESVAAVLNSVVQISSDATAEVQFPIGQNRFGSYTRCFVFIQHGITMNDLSRWLNPKNISLICSATIAERDAFVADEGTYKFTKSQVALTGFPRFDELVRKKRASEGVPKKTIMVMPTWRQELKDGLSSMEDTAEKGEYLRESHYGRAWLSFLFSQELLKMAEERGLEIVFVPHPAFRKYIALFELPTSVRVVDPAEVSLQDLFVSSAVLITDYSSVAFDVAFLDTPVIYYQFDADEIFSGKHNYRQGYFSYRDHGFGPVVSSGPALLSELDDVALTGFQVADRYKARRNDTFAFFDSDSSCRLFSAIADAIERS